MAKSSGALTDEWSSFELKAAVAAYLEMHRKELEEARYVKWHYSKALRENELTSRSQGSVEMRMQNISAVMMELKLPLLRAICREVRSAVVVSLF